MSKIIDFHSHVLPGIDDGSASVEQSLRMLQLEAEQGITQVIATPHFYARYDTPERFLRKRETAMTQLEGAMRDHPDLPQLKMGAEVYFFPGISDSEAIKQLTIDSKRFILLEMPEVSWTEEVYRQVEALHSSCGITPIIAHIDRYIRPFRTRGIPERLDRLPVLVQANASFFLDRTTRSMAMRMLRNDQIHLLGSDCHDLKHRKPNLGKAVALIEKQLGREVLDRIAFYQNQVLMETT